jgi:hypothetical protein
LKNLFNKRYRRVNSETGSWKKIWSFCLKSAK